MIGVDQTSGLVLLQNTAWVDDGPSRSFSWLDPEDGSLELLVEFEGVAAAGFDATGTHLVIVGGVTVLIDGAEIPIEVSLPGVDW